MGAHGRFAEDRFMTTVGGLPAHILLVHAVIVLVPLTAMAVLLVAVWPAARRRLTEATAVLGVVTAVVVPVTTDAGEWLERRVPRTALIRAHTEIGDMIVPWAIGLAMVAVAFLVRALLARRAARGTAEVAPGGGPGTARTTPVRRGMAGPDAGLPGGRAMSVVLAVVAVVVAVGSVVTVYRVGESGSRAVWTGQFSQQAQPPRGPGGPPPGG
jgi:hypothetical protein